MTVAKPPWEQHPTVSRVGIPAQVLQLIPTMCVPQEGVLGSVRKPGVIVTETSATAASTTSGTTTSSAGRADTHAGQALAQLESAVTTSNQWWKKMSV
jgi:hypothetical protein